MGPPSQCPRPILHCIGKVPPKNWWKMTHGKMHCQCKILVGILGKKEGKESISRIDGWFENSDNKITYDLSSQYKETRMVLQIYTDVNWLKLCNGYFFRKLSEALFLYVIKKVLKVSGAKEPKYMIATVKYLKCSDGGKSDFSNPGFKENYSGFLVLNP